MSVHHTDMASISTLEGAVAAYSLHIIYVSGLPYIDVQSGGISKAAKTGHGNDRVFAPEIWQRIAVFSSPFLQPPDLWKQCFGKTTFPHVGQLHRKLREWSINLAYTALAEMYYHLMFQPPFDAELQVNETCCRKVLTSVLGTNSPLEHEYLMTALKSYSLRMGFSGSGWVDSQTFREYFIDATFRYGKARIVPPHDARLRFCKKVVIRFHTVLTPGELAQACVCAAQAEWDTLS